MNNNEANMQMIERSIKQGGKSKSWDYFEREKKQGKGRIKRQERAAIHLAETMRIFAIPGDGEDKGPESIHLRDDEDNDSEQQWNQ